MVGSPLPKQARTTTPRHRQQRTPRAQGNTGFAFLCIFFVGTQETLTHGSENQESMKRGICLFFVFFSHCRHTEAPGLETWILRTSSERRSREAARAATAAWPWPRLCSGLRGPSTRFRLRASRWTSGSVLLRTYCRRTIGTLRSTFAPGCLFVPCTRLIESNGREPDHNTCTALVYRKRSGREENYRSCITPSHLLFLPTRGRKSSSLRPRAETACL